MLSSMTAYDNVRGRAYSPKSKAKILLQARDVHDLLTNWTDDADLGRSDFVEKVGSSRHSPSQNTDGETNGIATRENLTVSASAKCICGFKDNLNTELLRCQEKLHVFWDAQVAGTAPEGQQWSRRHTDLLGWLDGTSWHAKAKLAIRKKWQTFVDFANDSLLKNMSIAEFERTWRRLRRPSRSLSFSRSWRPSMRS